MKRYISAFFSIVLMFSLNVSSFAIELPDTTLVNKLEVNLNLDTEIYRALNGISDLEAEEYIVSASIATTNEDRTKSTNPIKIYTTTRKIPSPETEISVLESNAIGGSDIYATTSVVLLSSDKEEVGSKEKAYVTATMTLYWRDNPGIVNDFLGASGGWTRAKNPSTGTYPYLTNRYVYMKWNQTGTGQDDDTMTVSSNSFYIESDAMPANQYAYLLRSHVDIYDSLSASQTDEATVLELTVQTMPF